MARETIFIGLTDCEGNSLQELRAVCRKHGTGENRICRNDFSFCPDAFRNEIKWHCGMYRRRCRRRRGLTALKCLSNVLLSATAAGFVPFPMHKLNFSILY